MYPDLLHLGPLTIHTYGLLVAIGFTSALLLTIRFGKKEGFPPNQVMDIGFIIILCAVVGSRIAYVLINIGYYLENPLDILKIWQGGLVFSGGLIFVSFAMAWYLRRHSLSFWRVGDICAPAMALGQAIGRMGCFMAGCCYGKPTDLIWGVVFTHPNSLAPLHIPLHPTQLYAALSGFFIFGILLLLYRRKTFEGQIFLWFVILHSTGRMLIERYRGDDRGLIPNSEMTATQGVTLCILISAVVGLYILKSRQEKSGDLADHHERDRD
jgi:phosphatidylglycerol:prolipoprotein diacylglycerol transferase